MSRSRDAMSSNGALCGHCVSASESGDVVDEWGGLVTSQFGEGGIHLVCQRLVPVFVETKLVYT